MDVRFVIEFEESLKLTVTLDGAKLARKLEGTDSWGDTDVDGTLVLKLILWGQGMC
jgi:hypothetical protein